MDSGESSVDQKTRLSSVTHIKYVESEGQSLEEIRTLEHIDVEGATHFSIPFQLYDLKELAAALKVSKRTLEKSISERKLIPLWIRGQRRFTIEAINAFLQACKQPQ